MLVTTVREGEDVLVDDKVVIKVLSVGTVRVRLGIEAPKEVKISKRRGSEGVIGEGIEDAS